MGLNPSQIGLITSNKSISDFMDEICLLTPYTTEVYNWISGEMLRVYREINRTNFSSIISPQELATIIDLKVSEQISRTNAKILFDQVVSTGRSALAVAKEFEMIGGVTKEEIVYILKLLLEENPALSRDYNACKDNVVNYIIGSVKSITSGRAVAEDVISVVDEMLG